MKKKWGQRAQFFLPQGAPKKFWGRAGGGRRLEEKKKFKFLKRGFFQEFSKQKPKLFCKGVSFFFILFFPFFFTLPIPLQVVVVWEERRDLKKTFIFFFLANWKKFCWFCWIFLLKPFIFLKNFVLFPKKPFGLGPWPKIFFLGGPLLANCFWIFFQNF